MLKHVSLKIEVSRYFQGSGELVGDGHIKTPEAE